MSADLGSAEELTPARVTRLGRIRLLRMMAEHSPTGMFNVRADVLATLCDCAVALDIHAEDHEALKRLDEL